MNSYPLQLALAASRTIAAQADLFVYESSSTVPDTGDDRIVVQPDTGNEIVLRPGQAFRLPTGSRATTWTIRALSAVVEITGSVIIGSGEFFDANKVTTVKLDGEFANNVQVNNPPENPVRVALDDLTINAMGNIVAYSSAWSGSVALTANTYLEILAPSANVNGVLVSGIMIQQSGAAFQYVTAKPSLPGSTGQDGDHLEVVGTSASVSYFSSQRQFKIPPGYGLYVMSTTNDTRYRSVRYTVL